MICLCQRGLLREMFEFSAVLKVSKLIAKVESYQLMFTGGGGLLGLGPEAI